MKGTLLHSSEGRRTFVLVFAEGENPVSGLTEFAGQEELTSSELTGLGAFSRVELAFFDFESKEYQPIRVDEQVEVASFVGNLTRDSEGEPRLHAHLVVAKRSGSTVGGHLLSGNVRPTLEVVINESPAHLVRQPDPKTGLPLLPS